MHIVTMPIHSWQNELIAKRVMPYLLNSIIGATPDHEPIKSRQITPEIFLAQYTSDLAQRTVLVFATVMIRLFCNTNSHSGMLIVMF